MDYNASAVKYLFWFVETRETEKLLEEYSVERVKEKVIDKNLYQQKSRSRIVSEFGCILGRLQFLPDEIRKMLNNTDINTAKIITFIGCMGSDRLLFDLMYELYRDKVFLGETELTNADLNIFFKNKQDQNEKVAELTDGAIKKLKQVYCRYMMEAGLLKGSAYHREIAKPYIDQQLAMMLKKNGMEKYLAAITGDN